MNIEKTIESFKRLRIAVVGDLILDEYLFGEVERISPEAPVPVVTITDRRINPGGAANVALNLKTLGAEVELFGLVGRDRSGEELLTLLEGKGISVDGVIQVSDRPTTLKTRVISQGQQMIRLDKETTAPIGDDDANRVLKRIRDGIDKLDAVIFQDYNKGLLTPFFIHESINLFDRQIKAVDPKFENFFEYKGVDVFKPNVRELQRATGVKVKTEEELLSLMRRVRDELQTKFLVVTRGEKGILIYGDREIYSIPSLKREVFDVTGAGDTVIAIMVLGLAAGLPLVEAALLASIGAGIEVGKFGAASVFPEELKEAVEDEWDLLINAVEKRRI